MAGTIYATKEELTEAVVKLVYPNTTKSVTALGNQTAILNVVESIWAQLGSGGAGDLQAVLDLGSLADIPGDFDVTANGTRVWLTEGGTLMSGLSNTGSFVSTSGTTGVSFNSSSDFSTTGAVSFGVNETNINYYATSPSGNTANLKVGDVTLAFEAVSGSSFSKYTQDPSGFTIESEASSVDGGILVCGANGFKASIKDTGNAISIVGDPESDSGYKVSREYDPTNDATALWDIDGDLRVRTLNDGSANTEMLTVDSNGIVNKVPIPEDSAPSTYELKDTLPGYTLTEKKNYSFTCVNSSNMDIFLPNASAAHKGEWMLTLTNSVHGGTMTIQGLDSITFGSSYNSGALAELTTVIIRCVEFLGIGSTPVYKWIEVIKS